MSITRKYYEAYEERYRTVHALGAQWASDRPTPIVSEVMERYGIGPGQNILEIGCGEGRDSQAVLERGCDLLATDVSAEAIAYSQAKLPAYAARFRVLDCLSERPDTRYAFVFAVAVIHMLVLDEDRAGFYRFVYDALRDDGLALICTMGDGETEMQSDVSNAFTLQEREHESGKLMVAGTSCRMVSFASFERELRDNRLEILEKGITGALPDFDRLLYAVVKRE